MKIPITEIQKVSSTIGWYFTTQEAVIERRGTCPPAPSLNPAIDGYVITADRNIIHVRSDTFLSHRRPGEICFSFSSASNTVQNALDNALLYTAAHFKVDDALYSDRGQFSRRPCNSA